MTKYRRMNFSKNRPKPSISPWLVLFLMLAAVAVMGICKI